MILKFIQHYGRTISFLFGILAGLILYLLIDKFKNLQTSHVIDIIGIFTNIILGAVIVWMIQKKLSDDRGVKDYFISEVREIRDDYKHFVNKMLQKQINSKFAVEWFKNMSIKIGQLEYFLKYKLEIDDATITMNNRKIHKIVTDSTEFNNGFSKNAFGLMPRTNSEMMEAFKELKFAFIEIIVKVNRA